MEKILLLINANYPDKSSIDFACNIASLSDSKITGYFIESLFDEDLTDINIDEPSFLSTADTPTMNSAIIDTKQAVKLFKQKCLLKGIKSDVYINKSQAVEQVLFESRFSDLLIVDPEVGLYDVDEKLPSHFVKEILAKAECPVLLAPEKFEDINEIVFCYNSSPSSVFAIKQFAYLFPQLYSKKAMLLEVKSEEEEFDQNRLRMMEWLRGHFTSVHYHSLIGNVEDELLNYFLLKRKKIIVMGAYGRSMLSNFFKRSNAELLIRMIDMPIFITHH